VRRTSTEAWEDLASDVARAQPMPPAAVDSAFHSALLTPLSPDSTNQSNHVAILSLEYRAINYGAKWAVLFRYQFAYGAILVLIPP
jgi:hypothetical protein